MDLESMKIENSVDPPGSFAKHRVHPMYDFVANLTLGEWSRLTIYGCTPRRYAGMKSSIRSLILARFAERAQARFAYETEEDGTCWLYVMPYRDE